MPWLSCTRKRRNSAVSPPPMATDALIGNDVIDLSPSCAGNRLPTLRFLERVFTQTERGLIQRSSRQRETAWCLWAAKETAFKIARKMDVAAVFSPREFAVDMPPLTAFRDGRFAEGAVRSRYGLVFARWDVTDDCIHCFGSTVAATIHGESRQIAVGVRDTEKWMNPYAKQDFTRRELDSVRAEESFLARCLAKELLAVRGLKNVELDRFRAGEALAPPALFQDGKNMKGCDVSLSHDGRFVAAVIHIAPSHLSPGAPIPSVPARKPFYRASRRCP